MEIENLKAYLANIGMTITDLCKIIGCNRSHISRVIHGHRNASKRLANEIMNATSGVVRLRTRTRKKDMKHKEKKSKQKNK